MNFTPVKTPGILRHSFKNLIWSIPSTKKTIYLTFDDGPTSEITDWTLDILLKYNAKATFFCIGKNVEKHPQIYKRILSEGHGIGNHSYTHLKGWKTDTKTYTKDIFSAAKLIDSKLFRPPYGQITPKQIKAISKQEYQIVMWSILSLDWDKSIDKETCANNIIRQSTSGDIIVFHDSIKAKKNMQYALPEVIDYFSKKGFEFKRIPESIQ